ncbi:RNA polymerase sigma factor [Candidatus Parcubacteria bacterium]|nr:RNA polymerase sigma factor [Candidatus Parcubacteria bacterium]
MSDHYSIFNELYDDNVENIYRFIYLKVNSDDIAKDLTSETFTKVWKSLNNGQKFDNSRAFTFQVARNLIIDHYRGKNKTTIPLSECSEMSDPSSDIEKRFQLSSDIDEIKIALSGLKDEYREAITLRYVEDMPISEVAKILGKKQGTVRVILHRGLKALRESITHGA